MKCKGEFIWRHGRREGGARERKRERGTKNRDHERVKNHENQERQKNQESMWLKEQVFTGVEAGRGTPGLEGFRVGGRVRREERSLRNSGSLVASACFGMLIGTSEICLAFLWN